MWPAGEYCVVWSLVSTKGRIVKHYTENSLFSPFSPIEFCCSRNGRNFDTIGGPAVVRYRVFVNFLLGISCVLCRLVDMIVIIIFYLLFEEDFFDLQPMYFIYKYNEFLIVFEWKCIIYVWTEKSWLYFI